MPASQPACLPPCLPVCLPSCLPGSKTGTRGGAAAAKQSSSSLLGPCCLYCLPVPQRPRVPGDVYNGEVVAAKVMDIGGSAAVQEAFLNVGGTHGTGPGPGAGTGQGLAWAGLGLRSALALRSVLAALHCIAWPLARIQAPADASAPRCAGGDAAPAVEAPSHRWILRRHAGGQQGRGADGVRRRYCRRYCSRQWERWRPPPARCNACLLHWHCAVPAQLCKGIAADGRASPSGSCRMESTSCPSLFFPALPRARRCPPQAATCTARWSLWPRAAPASGCLGGSGGGGGWPMTWPRPSTTCTPRAWCTWMW